MTRKAILALQELPEHMRDSVRAYVDDHRPVGHFLSAVLANDLCKAVAHADEENLVALGAYVRWFYNHAPARCWGSRRRVGAWLAHKEA